MGEWMDIQTKRNEDMEQRVKGTSKREQTETCFQYAEREYLRRSQKFIGSLGQKAQKSIGSLGQSTPKLTNVDSITIAKHKNGRYYLRVIFNNFGHSEIFFLSKEETRSFLTQLFHYRFVFLYLSAFCVFSLSLLCSTNFDFSERHLFIL